MINVTVHGPDGRQLGVIDIHCVEGTGRDPDSINTYTAALYSFGSHPPPFWVARHATIEHRHGDGWPVLVREAIEAMEVGG